MRWTGRKPARLVHTVQMFGDVPQEHQTNDMHCTRTQWETDACSISQRINEKMNLPISLAIIINEASFSQTHGWLRTLSARQPRSIRAVLGITADFCVILILNISGISYWNCYFLNYMKNSITVMKKLFNQISRGSEVWTWTTSVSEHTRKNPHAFQALPNSYLSY
jgi:hypothetical protein